MQTLQDLALSFRLYGVCEPCNRFEALDIPALIEREGGTYPISQLRLRVACSQCKRRTQDLRIVYVGPNGSVAGFHYARRQW